MAIKEVSYAEFSFDALKPGQKTERHAPLFPRVVLEDFLKEEAAPGGGAAPDEHGGVGHVAELGPGEFFGEMCLVEPARRCASVMSPSNAVR